MTWNPSKEAVESIIELLNAASKPSTNEQHQEIFKRLNEAEKHPEFCNYLVFVLAEMKNQSDEVRQRAGLLLKNCILRKFDSLQPQTIEYVKLQTLRTIGDPHKSIRNTVGIIITTIAQRLKLTKWPNLLHQLTEFLSSSDANVVLGALRTIGNIAEDMPVHCDDEEIGRPLNQLVPKLIEIIQSPIEEFRVIALFALNQYLYSMPQILSAKMDVFIQAVFQLTNDPSTRVQSRVIKVFTSLLFCRLPVLMDQIGNIINYVITCCSSKDEETARDSSDFWTSFCESELPAQILVQYLPKILPLLLKNIVYSDEQLRQLEEDEEDDAIERNILPMESIHEMRKDGWEGASQISGWDLRKASAAALDTMSLCLESDLLKSLLPILQEKLANQNDWKIRESGILAIGAIAEGCFDPMREHLEHILPFLLQMLNDQQPLVRSITCWTISRYSNYYFEFPDEKYFKPIMESLLQRIMDKQKKVQEAGCSAFATLEEATGQIKLTPFLPQILETFMSAFKIYKSKNLLILYDCIMTLAEVSGPVLNDEKLIPIFMPPIMNRWSQLRNDDRQIFPSFSCLSCLATTLRQGFIPYAKPVFERCLQMIQATFEEENKAKDAFAKGNKDYPTPDKDFTVAALDVLAGIVEGLQADFDSLVEGTRLLEWLYQCSKDEYAALRQSAFVLLGDLAKVCIDRLKPHLKDFLEVAADNLHPQYSSVCNNASWCIGELSVKVGADMKPYVEGLMTRLIPILNEQNWEASLLENTAITIGRLGLVCPEAVAPALPHFGKAWCIVLSRYREDHEKEHAFRGLCLVISKNPEAVLPFFIDLCRAIASWSSPSQSLGNMFAELLMSYKKSLAANWENVIGKCESPLRKHLESRYGLH